MGFIACLRMLLGRERRQHLLFMARQSGEMAAPNREISSHNKAQENKQ